MNGFYPQIEKALNQLLDLRSRQEKDAFLANCPPTVAQFIRDNYDLDQLEMGDDTSSESVLRPLAGGFVPGVQEPKQRSGERVGEYLLERRITHTLLSDVYMASKPADPFYQYVLKFGLREDSEKLLEAEHAFLRKQQDNLFVVDPVALERDQQGTHYLVTRYVRGDCLGDFLKKRPDLARRELLEIFAELCETLAVIHQENCVHRDLKPNNVVIAVQNGKAYPILLDFGIAASLDQNADNHPRLIHMGTEAYAAPERLSGGLGGVESDLYSLGVMLTEALGGTRANWQSRHFKDLDGRTLPKDLCALLARCLAEEPCKRYSSAYALASDLRRIIAKRPISLWADKPGYRVRCFLHRHPLSSSLSLLVLLILSVGALHLRALEAERRFQDVIMAKTNDLSSSMLEIHRTSESAWKHARDTLSKQLENQRQAVTQLETLHKDDERYPDAKNVALGWAFFQVGEYEHALNYLNAAPDCRQVAYPHYVTLANLALYEETLVGLVHFSGVARTRRNARADEYLKAAKIAFSRCGPSLDSDDRDYLQMAFHFYGQPVSERADEALSGVDLLLGKYPTDARYHTLKARIYLWRALFDPQYNGDDLSTLRQLEEACKAFQRSISLEFCRSAHHTELAATLHLMAHYVQDTQRREYLERGIKQARMALAIYPRDGRGHMVLAALLNQLNEDPDMLLEARVHAERALALVLKDSQAELEIRVAWMRIMGNLARDKKTPLALAYLERAVETGEALMPEQDAAAAYALSVVRRQLAERQHQSPGRKQVLWEQALFANEKAREWEPNNPLYQQHQLYIYNGMIKSAYDNFLDPRPIWETMKKVMTAVDSSYYAHSWFAEAATAVGQYVHGSGGDGRSYYQEAHQHLEQARVIEPDKTAATKNSIFNLLQWAAAAATYGESPESYLQQAHAELPKLVDYDRYDYYRGLVQMEIARHHPGQKQGDAALREATDALTLEVANANFAPWVAVARAQLAVLHAREYSATVKEKQAAFSDALQTLATIPDNHQVSGEAFFVRAEVAVLKALSNDQDPALIATAETALAALDDTPMFSDKALLLSLWASRLPQDHHLVDKAQAKAVRALDDLSAADVGRHPELRAYRLLIQVSTGLPESAKKALDDLRQQYPFLKRRPFL